MKQQKIMVWIEYKPSTAVSCASQTILLPTRGFRVEVSLREERVGWILRPLKLENRTAEVDPTTGVREAVGRAEACGTIKVSRRPAMARELGENGYSHRRSAYCA